MLYNFIPTSSDFNQLTKIKNRGHFYLKKKNRIKKLKKKKTMSVL